MLRRHSSHCYLGRYAWRNYTALIRNPDVFCYFYSANIDAGYIPDVVSVLAADAGESFITGVLLPHGVTPLPVMAVASHTCPRLG
jgi:hypothetical protein